MRRGSRRAARAPVTFLAVDVPVGASGRAQLLKLGVESLAVGADAGMAETWLCDGVAVISFSKRKPLIGQGQANFLKVLIYATCDKRKPRAMRIPDICFFATLV
jgi:hypothetical protein